MKNHSQPLSKLWSKLSTSIGCAILLDLNISCMRIPDHSALVSLWVLVVKEFEATSRLESKSHK